MVAASTILATFFVVELTTALIIGSLALLADASHMLTDLVALFMGLTALMLARRGSKSAARTYGWHRAEVFTAVANAMLLLGVSVFIVYEAIERLGKKPEVPGWPMILVALAALAANTAVVLLLRSHAEQPGRQGAYMEVLADAVSSLGVLIAGIVTVTTRWPYADTVVAVLVALWVLPGRSRWRARRCASSESSPAHIDVVELRSALAAVDGVTEVHDLHVWTLAPGRDMVTAHLASDGRSAGCSTTRGRCWPPADSTRHRSGGAPGSSDGAPSPKTSRPGTLPGQPQFGARRRVAVVEQIPATFELVGLADIVGGAGQAATHRRNRGWARGRRALGRNPSSRCGAVGPGRGGIRCARRRKR